MATIHTNFLTGNDTTGNGSALAPYKTVSKALSVAVDNDLVKVAGGELTQIPGATVTVPLRGTTFTTNIDLTSHFVQGDSVFIDTSSTDAFPVIANGLPVSGVLSNSLTFPGDVTANFAPGTYPVYKLSQYHYTAASGTYETFAAFTANNVQVEGGWDSTFTTQIGWTGVKTMATSATSNFTTTWNGLLKQNVVFNKFVFSNINNAFGGSNSSIGINEVVFNRVSVPFGISNFGVYHPTSVGFTTIYSYGSTLSNSWNGAGNSPTTLFLKQWVTATTTTGNRDVIKVGFGLTMGLAAPTVRSLEVNWRSLNNVSGTQAIIGGGTSDVGDICIDKLNMFIGAATQHPIMRFAGNAVAWRWIGDVNVNIIDGSRAGIVPFFQSGTDNLSTTAEAPLNLNRTSGRLENLPWIIGGTFSATSAIINCQRAMMYGKDTEGQKVINMDNIVKWADPTQFVTGSNSLRFKLTSNSAGVDTIRYFTAILDKPISTDPFQIRLKVKGSKAFQIGIPELIYGPSFSKFITGAPSTNQITTTWQDITFTINPASVTDWNFANDGLMQVVIPVSSSVVLPSEVEFMWIDSVVVL